MQFSLATVVLALATSVAALPSLGPNAGGVGNANGVGNHDNGNVRFPVKNDVTVQQAQHRCGDHTQLSCCQKASYAGDTVNANSGILGGALSSLIGNGGSTEGLGLFDQCSKLPINLLLTDLINRQCNENIACCQDSPSEGNGLVGVGLPCIALGSLL
ncbi:hypothetical protein VTN02DRAFT_4094 [Thermoascus thermophilus]